MSVINIQDMKMKKLDKKLGRVTGTAYFCDADAEPLWTERIWKDDNGWHIKRGEHLLTFCTEVFNECPAVKVIHLKMPSQNRVITIGCRNGTAVPVHIDSIFPDVAEAIFNDNKGPNPVGLHTDDLQKGSLGAK